MAEHHKAEMITIAKDGDLLLEVGDGGDTTLRVSSAILAGASKYFAAITSPRFREGQQSRSAESPQKITLEDDKAFAMQDLCSLLHGEEMAELYAPATSERLLHLAVVVDKYDCVGRLRLHTSNMLFTYLHDHIDQDYENKHLDQLLAATFLLDSKRCFWTVSKRLMLDTLTTEGTWPKELSRDIIPGRIFDAVDHKRLVAITEATHELSGCLLWFCPMGGDACLDRARREYGDFFGPEHDRTRMPIRDIIEQARNTSRWLACEHMLGVEGADQFDKLENMIAHLKDSCAGLCLPCARAGNGLRQECTIESHK